VTIAESTEGESPGRPERPERPERRSGGSSTDGEIGLYQLRAHVSATEYLRQMWDRRFFAVTMPMETLRAKHQHTLFGNIWHLANPMMSVLTFYIVFGIILKADQGIENFVLWLMVGVTAFGLTSASISGGATALTANEGIMRSVRFPRALLPVSTIVGRLATFGIELVVLAFFALVTGEGVSIRWLALPLVLILQTAFNLGGAFIAARLNDSFNDIQQIIPFVFRLMMYAAGVMFPIRTVPEIQNNPTLKWLVDNNPIVQILDLWRWVFLGTPVDLGVLIRLIIVTTVLLLWGFRFFRTNELIYGRS
jgi:teichoic acid transport system permease protein